MGGYVSHVGAVAIDGGRAVGNVSVRRHRLVSHSRGDERHGRRADQDVLGRICGTRSERAWNTRGWSPKAYKTNHHEVVVSPEEFFDALPKLVWHEDEPLAHPSSVALYFVSQLASQHVKVVLTGEGSDELLAGYGRYRKTIYNLALGARYHGLMPARRKTRSCADESRTLPEVADCGRSLSRTFLSLPPDIESIYFDNFAVFPRAMQQRCCRRETRGRIGERSIRMRACAHVLAEHRCRRRCSIGCSTPTSRPICMNC